MRTRTTILAIACLLLALAVGWWGRGLLDGEARHGGAGDVATDDGLCPGGGEPLYWKAPMNPDFIRNTPGKSPMGMDLVPVCPDAAQAAPGTVRIDAATAQRIGVRTARVERRDLTSTIRAVGRVTVDERRVAHVHTKVQGWVEQLSVDYVGQAVMRGQPLLEIYSPELVATQEELLLAARYRDATAGSPFKDVSRGGASLYDATRRRLALWDVPDRDVERLLKTGEVKRALTLYAPTAGVVTSRPQSPGEDGDWDLACYEVRRHHPVMTHLSNVVGAGRVLPRVCDKVRPDLVMLCSYDVALAATWVLRGSRNRSRWGFRRRRLCLQIGRATRPRRASMW